MTHDALRRRFGEFLTKAETGIYGLLAVLLSVTALVTIVNAARILWEGLGQRSVAAQTLRALNEMLIVMMLVEILHTVRISIRSHMLAMTEPFLVVGLIAAIRRILVITLEAAALGKEAWPAEGASSVLHSSTVEFGLLALLVLILVLSIALLRRYAPAAEQLEEV
jgi:hypothetical protein